MSARQRRRALSTTVSSTASRSEVARPRTASTPLVAACCSRASARSRRRRSTSSRSPPSAPTPSATSPPSRTTPTSQDQSARGRQVVSSRRTSNTTGTGGGLAGPAAGRARSGHGRRPFQRRAPRPGSRCRTAPGSGPGPSHMPSLSIRSSSRRLVPLATSGWTSLPGPQSGSPTWAGWLATSPQSSGRVVAGADQQALRARGVPGGVEQAELVVEDPVAVEQLGHPEGLERGDAAVERHPVVLVAPGGEQLPVGPLDQVAGPREPRPGPVAVPGQVPADVVEVQVGEDDQVDLVRLDPGGGQLLREPSRGPDPGWRRAPRARRPRCRPAPPGPGPGPRSTSRAAASGRPR